MPGDPSASFKPWSRFLHVCVVTQATTICLRFSVCLLSNWPPNSKICLPYHRDALGLLRNHPASLAMKCPISRDIEGYSLRTPTDSVNRRLRFLAPIGPTVWKSESD